MMHPQSMNETRSRIDDRDVDATASAPREPNRRECAGVPRTDDEYLHPAALRSVHIHVTRKPFRL